MLVCLFSDCAEASSHSWMDQRESEEQAKQCSNFTLLFKGKDCAVQEYLQGMIKKKLHRIKMHIKNRQSFDVTIIAANLTF